MTTTVSDNGLITISSAYGVKDTIDRVETLEAQRPAKAARVDSARLDLERTHVVAPFDAYVTSLDISEGAFAHPGTPFFTLIDTRNWYVIAP